MKNRTTANKILIPIILALGFVPILVHEYTYNTHLSAFTWYPDGAERQVDFFLAYKSFAIMALGLVMLLILVSSYIKKKTALSFEPAFYLLLAYAALVLISGLLSPYRAYAFRGGYEIFESVWVVLSYAIFCYYTYHYVQTADQAHTVLQWSGIGIMIVSLIGIFQYYDRDFFGSTLGKMIISDPSRWDDLDGVKIIFPAGSIYTTLYNPDFLSFYYGLLLPISIVLAISASKAWQRIIYSLVTVLFFICLFGCKAASGPLALALTAVFCFYLLLSRRKRAFYIGIGGGIAAIAAGIVILFGTSFGHTVSARILGSSHVTDSYVIQDVATNNDNISFTINDQTLVLSYESDAQAGFFQLAASDAEGNPVPYSLLDEEEGIYALDNDAYGSCTIQPSYYDETTIGMQVVMGGKTMYFVKQSDDTYYYRNAAGKLVKIEKIPASRLFFDEFLGRGLIWNRTLPLLKKYIILGIGANNYVLAYPQNDYLYHINLGSATTYDVKAHCWPLQQWVENGLLATLCLLGFYLWYVVQSVRIYRRADLKDPTVLLGFGIFLGTMAYMFASLANDSNVNTAPVFWVVLGLGFAMNRMITSTSP